jgi:hypothetical protein
MSGQQHDDEAQLQLASERGARTPAVARGASGAVTRLLGVVAASVLAICTFSALGLALLTTLYDRGVVGHKGSEEMEGLAYLAGGIVGGAIVGLVVAVWVGLRVWQGRWALLAILAGVSCVTAVAIAVAAS